MEEKTFFVSKAAYIAKGDKKIQLADLKKGMKVSVKYRIAKGRIVASDINIIAPPKLLRKKVKEKPAEPTKK